MVHAPAFCVKHGRNAAITIASIAAAQADGTAPAAQSPEDLGRLMLGVLLGVRVLARSKPDRELLEGMARPALALLDLPATASATEIAT